MALPIKPPPVLEGKAAREFLEKVANFRDDTSREKVQQGLRETRAFLAKYYNPYND